MSPDWQSIVSAALGSIGVTGIAKFFLQRSAEKLEEIPEKLSEIKQQIAAMSVQLGVVSDLKKTVQEHDRIISALTAERKFKKMGNCLQTDD